MKFDIIIKNGTIVTSKGRLSADIAIINSKIAAIAEYGVFQNEAPEIIDATGLFLLPGLIDAHVHFRDPGLTYKEDFKSGSESALCGGITYVVDMPNVKPVTSSAERLRERIAKAKDHAKIDVGFFCLLTSDNLNEMEGMHQVGAVGYKIYLGASVGDIAAPPDGVMFEQYLKAAQLGMRIGHHAENNDINDYYTKKTKENGTTEPSALIEARPDFSEVEAVNKAIIFAKYTNAKIHIFHVSSGKTVDLIRKAKEEGVDITAETCPHYLLLSEKDYSRLGAIIKVFPTIKTEEDQKKLWQGIYDGTIEMIATDHAPHTKQEKVGDVWDVMAGLAGVEISVKLMLNEVNKGNLTLEQLSALMSENPARVWDLKGRGVISVGSKANITIIDLDKKSIIKNSELHGKSNITAFEELEVTGEPVMVVLNGVIHRLTKTKQ